MKRICVPRKNSEQLSCFTYKPKNASVMKDYIALHGLVPLNELPMHLRGKIPDDEIWVRTETYENEEKMKSLNTHESVELFCMVALKMKYKTAHRIAEVADGAY